MSDLAAYYQTIALFLEKGMDIELIPVPEGVTTKESEKAKKEEKEKARLRELVPSNATLVVVEKGDMNLHYKRFVITHKKDYQDKTVYKGGFQLLLRSGRDGLTYSFQSMDWAPEQYEVKDMNLIIKTPFYAEEVSFMTDGTISQKAEVELKSDLLKPIE